MKKKFLEIGKIVTTHGVMGEVKVYPWCDTPAFLTGFSTLYFHKGKDPVSVQQARVHKNMVLLKLQGIDTVEAAGAAQQILYADRADMPLEKGEYFIQDLIGLTVVDAGTGKNTERLAMFLKPGRTTYIISPSPANRKS